MHGLVPSSSSSSSDRRAALSFLGKSAAALAVPILGPTNTAAVAAPSDDGFDIDSYLKSGGVPMPMGVSGQGGKMRPGKTLSWLASLCLELSRY